MASEVARYFPAAGARWERREADALGLSSERLREASEHALGTEIRWPRDLLEVVAATDAPPYNEALGPVKERGGPSGLVLRGGYLAHEWGEPGRVDVTFSATKSYLSLLAGIAWDRRLIRDPHDLVRDYVDDGGFDSEHNGKITWHHMLTQTSEWSGTLFGIPDSVDHNRSTSEPGAKKGEPRALREPGTYFEYNDVRVNRFALALLHVWREPLPEVLRREVMEPIGASGAWEWHGYRNAWVEIDGKRMQSVPGGAHWGGGLWIDSYDHARIGLLMLRGGEWDGRRIVSEAWVERSTAPSEQNARYGYMWWLNTGRRMVPSASEGAFVAQGGGGNWIFVDRERDLVVVTRWAQDPRGVIDRVVQAVES